MSTPSIPKKIDKSHYEIADLYLDQQYVAYRVLDKIHEWMTCPDLSAFVPLRCTLMGQGGMGKSVLILTIVSVLRRSFNLNNVVQVHQENLEHNMSRRRTKNMSASDSASLIFKDFRLFLSYRFCRHPTCCCVPTKCGTVLGNRLLTRRLPSRIQFVRRSD